MLVKCISKKKKNLSFLEFARHWPQPDVASQAVDLQHLGFYLSSLNYSLHTCCWAVGLRLSLPSSVIFLCPCGCLARVAQANQVRVRGDELPQPHLWSVTSEKGVSNKMSTKQLVRPVRRVGGHTCGEGFFVVWCFLALWS